MQSVVVSKISDDIEQLELLYLELEHFLICLDTCSYYIVDKVWDHDIMSKLLSSVFSFLCSCSETKARLLAERDRASAETAFKALDTDENGR